MDPMLFQYNVNRTKLTQQSRDIARAVLVDGMPQVAAARRWGVSQPRVAAICRLVRDPDLTADGEPRQPRSDVWVAVRVPPDVAVEIREMAKSGRKRTKARKVAERARDAEIAATGSVFGIGEVVDPDAD
jgi:hypothetical protein